MLDAAHGASYRQLLKSASCALCIVNAWLWVARMWDRTVQTRAAQGGIKMVLATIAMCPHTVIL